ncbi:MAG: AraC family transcriptional regulator [Candidatus Methylacidiphilales bacterium]
METTAAMLPDAAAQLIRPGTAASTVPRLYLNRILAPGEFGHIARPQHTRQRPLAPHTHDFAEIFWVNSGRGRHLINGRAEPLVPGDFQCIRPEDEHTLEAAGSEPLTITNVAFPAEVLDWLRGRYFTGAPRWFWSPVRTTTADLDLERLDETGLHTLNAAGDRLALAPRDRLHFEHFLLGVFAELSARGSTDPDSDSSTQVPDWLSAACRKMRSADLLREGLPAFFRLAGRSPEHVARAMRSSLGMTPSEFINRRRIAHAAFQLQMTVRPVTEIAMDAGYENLSHFFHVFRRIHGMSPRQYRSKMMASAGMGH